MKLHFRHILVTFALLQGTLAWAEPSLEQVYEATRSGRLEEAQQMMQEVLRAHPNSAKAHFTEAEVLARSGNLAGGRDELALAQKLQPGLPFAKPSAVAELKNELDRSTGSATVPAGGTGHTPWGTLLVVGGIALLLVIWLVRRQTAQGPAGMGMMPRPGGGYYNNGMGGGVPPSMGPTGGMGGG
ncbi:tetratricopeptide repeat protein, partial [Ferrovum myxofaciens]